MNKELIISELNLKPFGSQGWFSNKDESCPYCGKTDKWGVIFSERGGVFHCWKCATKVSLSSFLIAINRKDLSKKSYVAHSGFFMKELVEEDDNDKEDELPQVNLPIDLKRLNDNIYLNRRGFNKHHYDEFEPSVTFSPLERKYEGYIIFKIKENDRVVAFLSRSLHSKKWHDNNLKRYKQGTCPLQLRYRNSDSRFNDIVGGYDDVKQGDTVIIVEGIFDKVGVDNYLLRHNMNNYSCVFTFGCSISKTQIKKIKDKGISNVILMYDGDAITELTEFGRRLSLYFNTEIWELPNNTDPNEATEEDFKNIKKYQPINYKKLCSIK